jgi:AcrR family transcriptional regulator
LNFIRPRSPTVGNLRQRALAAAHRRLEQCGAAGISLRPIAAELGTGVGSLYYHFANKDALLAELATDGFAELGGWMAMAAAAPPKGDPFFAACHAYLGFTRHRPALYALMYDERILAGHERVRQAEAAAFEIFSRTLEGAGPAQEDVADVALTLWTLGRGMASISSRFGGAAAPGARQMVGRILRGLAALADSPIQALGAAASDAA